MMPAGHPLLLEFEVVYQILCFAIGPQTDESRWRR
jgi:hypothetical protein